MSVPYVFHCSQFCRVAYDYASRFAAVFACVNALVEKHEPLGTPAENEKSEAAGDTVSQARIAKKWHDYSHRGVRPVFSYLRLHRWPLLSGISQLSVTPACRPNRPHGCCVNPMGRGALWQSESRYNACRNWTRGTQRDPSLDWNNLSAAKRDPQSSIPCGTVSGWRIRCSS